MDFTPLPSELEELILCSCCHLPFNDTDAVPKLFSCRHYFCLKCVQQVLMKGSELYCVHCWKRTELSGLADMKPENLPTHNAILYLSQNLSMISSSGSPAASGAPSTAAAAAVGGSVGGVSGNGTKKPPDKSGTNGTASTAAGENCLTHAMPNALWCLKCNVLLCRACASTEEHRNHTVKTQAEARDQIRSDIASDLLLMQKSLSELQHFVFKQRDFLLKILEACTALKTQVETELINHLPTFEVAEIRSNLTKAKLFLSMLEQQSPAEAYKLYANLNIEKQRLQSKYQEMYLQCKLDDLIQHYGVLFDFELIKQALSNLNTIDPISFGNGAIGGGLGVTASGATINGHHNSILLLANYCISQLAVVPHSPNHGGLLGGPPGMPQPPQLSGSYASQLNDMAIIIAPPLHQSGSRTDGSNSARTSGSGSAYLSEILNGSAMQHLHQHSGSSQHQPLTPPGHPLSSSSSSVVSLVPSSAQQQVQKQVQAAVGSLLCNPSVHVYPIYYFNIEINGQPFGRVLIEVRNDVAPKMAKNFGALASGDLGFGYKGCSIFQCWENESIITGDFELNNGRGGRSVFEEGFFMPDDTKILAIRGSVGMRRSQKRHDNMGLVGSQFRIILREMRGFTGIFAFVVEGLELVEKISQAGDSAGKPQSSVMIVNCGKWQ
ncbi:peptidyl-prolyl cis-trans isomerase [Culex quinquefasciatus]|uniref:Peptidyl-prolyl cis-trans isomerase n=1 Tax=Culex quinquefasciatus TaxID=7176 RepID=B0WJW7_CULQU|nr:peptidyl-prolyl cis-trans isomerase [Culex quinquefasciatus]|eukprot:XP_001849001.1 peptidyl-prolyl cis-trans isomerase [Culex quinquefasciatus]